MSWYLANEDEILGQFASACGIMDLRKSAEDHHALLSFLDEGHTSDVSGVESDLKEITEGDAGSIAKALGELLKGQTHVSITDGSEA